MEVPSESLIIRGMKVSDEFFCLFCPFRLLGELLFLFADINPVSFSKSRRSHNRLSGTDS